MDGSISTLTRPTGQGTTHGRRDPRGWQVPISRADGAAPERARGKSLTSALTRVRVLVLAFAILAAGFAAVAPQTAQEADAAGPCGVSSVVRYGVSNGYYYVWGSGTASCNYSLSQGIQVDLFAIDSWGNYTRVARGSSYVVAKAISAQNSAWAYCGVRYQLRTTHSASGHGATNHWSNILRVC